MHDSFDYDDLRENKEFHKNVTSGKYKTLKAAINVAEKKNKPYKTEEASFELDDDNDDWDDRDDRDDDNDRYDRDDRNERYNNKAKAQYEVEMKNGRKERNVIINANK